MNIQEYISSGIVQSYVLGLADEAERAEFERMCDLHPEVRAARDEFEIALEQHALENQVQPSATVKSRVFSAIGMESVTPDTAQNSSPLRGTPLSKGAVETREENSRVPESFKREAEVVRMSSWKKFLSAAAVILLLISVGFNFYLYNRSKQYSAQYQDLLAQQTQLAANNDVLQTRLTEYESAMNMMKDPSMAVVKMPAIPNGPDPSSLTTVYWHTTTKDVFLAVNNLPAPAADHQYQLWAMVDGKPVDAGVFEIKQGPGMVKMKNIPKAQAFAITLEKKGGSPTPSLDKLYVMGKV